MLTSPTVSAGRIAWPGPRTPRQLPAFRYRKEKSSERPTVCWRGLDSNFQYAGAVNLVVAPFMPPNARDGSVRPLSFSGSTTPCIKAAWTRPPRPRSVPATHRAEFCVVREENGNALPGDRARRSRPGARQPLVRSEGAAAGPPSLPSGNPIWSVAISTRSMRFRGARRQPWLGALVSAEPSTAPPSPDLPRGTLPRHRPEAHRETRPTA